MRCIAEADPAAFLAATARFRSADPVLTNIITTNAEARSAGRIPLEAGSRWFHLVDDDGSTAGIAMRIPPRGMSVSPMGDAATAERFAPRSPPGSTFPVVLARPPARTGSRRVTAQPPDARTRWRCRSAFLRCGQ